MSELRFETCTMPAAALGPENPLPERLGRPAPQLIERSAEIPAEIYENMGIGHVASILPYRVQDGYTRELKSTSFRLAILENEILRAAFLVEYGGRLWSLVHKPSGDELLSVNPVFQLANLALRNAWFSGGVEWNIGTTGHSPLTCSPLFAARVEGLDGTPILRLYEWERLREVPFQIDAYLPDGSPVLFLRVRILNLHGHDVPMYWWSNIAVPETEDTRVVVPAEFAYVLTGGGHQLQRIPVPRDKGFDYTYATNLRQAGDYFFDLQNHPRPWIAALDGAGQGLVQVSSRRMVGRKLWVWGMGTGGRNWQKFLSPGGQGYIEIQAGLTRTQLEHLRMPARGEWAWLEAYGRLAVDPALVHGSDWQVARATVEAALERLLPQDSLAAEFNRGQELVDLSPDEICHRGSGWGALARRRGETEPQPQFFPPGLIFDDQSLTLEQAPWIRLLETGSPGEIEPQAAPSAFMVSDHWRQLLERALENEEGQSWWAWCHLGVMRAAAGDRAGAREAWQRSLELQWTLWALRNLALLSWEAGRLAEAAEMLMAALKEAPSLLPLAIECGSCLIEAGNSGAWLDLLASLPSPIRNASRIRLLEAQAALVQGELETVKRFFDEKVVVVDLREGDQSLSDLWFAYHQQRLEVEEGIPVDDALRQRVREQYPLPEEFDFRMVEEYQL